MRYLRAAEFPRAPSAARPLELHGRVFRGSAVVSEGLLTDKQLRSSAWVRLRQDVYADSSLPRTHRILISAVGLTLPAGAGFTGRSAAVLWGVPDIASQPIRSRSCCLRGCAGTLARACVCAHRCTARPSPCG